MKNYLSFFAILLVLGFTSCSSSDSMSEQKNNTTEGTYISGQSAVQDTESQPNIVQVAASSPDHTTLVQAVTAAKLVDVLVNAGPFTVFAPTNAAFDALPPGTVKDLLKPANIDALQNILQYHVAVAVYKLENIRNNQTLGMVNGQNVTFEVNDSGVKINGSNIIASIPASNGIIHVIDAVILPPAQ